MTPPTTQLTLLPVHPDTTIEDPSSQAGESWNSILETIAAQPGHEHTYWGRRVEDPSIVHLYVGTQPSSRTQKQKISKPI
jgi:hypothetical protein